MIKLIASDLDGTLLPSGEKRLCVGIESAIKAALGKGIRFALITGRNYTSACAACPTLPAGIYLYCCGGAVGIKDGKTLYSKPVNSESVIRALSDAKRLCRSVMLSGATETYFCGDDGIYKELCREHGPATRITDMRDIDKPIYKISFFSPVNNPVYAHAPSGLRLWYRRNGLEEYINRFAGKGQAISDLMMRENALAHEVVAAGNEISDDADMLKKAGVRYSTTAALSKEANAILIDEALEIFKI